jgi:hypothetical protein
LELEPNKTRWAVHGDLLKVWFNGELVGEVQLKEFPNLILELAKALQETSK